MNWDYRTNRSDQIKPHEMTILMIEDNAVNLKILMRLLIDVGYQLLIAEDGESGLDMAINRQPDLILLDIVLPKLDGFTVCGKLKEDPRTKQIPVIFMTGVTDTANKVRGFELGAVDYITKPIQTSEVLARIHTHLHILELQKNLENEVIVRGRLINELDAFSQMVAHDLKGPLTHIIGYAELLADDYQSYPQEEVSSYLATLASSSKMMINIVDELLLLASVRQKDVEMEPVDIKSVVEDVISRLQEQFNENDAELIFDNELPIVRGYRPWLEEVWVNLISNGLKYGGTPPKLIIGSEDYPQGMVRFWIKDNGAGLSTEQKQGLYKPFTRLQPQDTDGYGLGLSIVARIIERLGGIVGVESEPGQGSTFYFTLPLQPV